MIDILMITHNRLEYLKKSLPSIMGQGNLIIWDNASDDETKNWLRQQNLNIYFSSTNKSLAEVTTEVFLNSKAEFVGKVDPDMILPLDWSKRLIDAHRKYHFGFIGGFHFRPEDIVNIEPNIEDFNGIKLWRKHHIGGQYVIRRKDFKGYKGKGLMGLSEYQAEVGLVNGYLWNPILWVEHMEDGRSQHFINSEEYRKYKLETRHITLEQYTSSIPNQNYLKENTK